MLNRTYFRRGNVTEEKPAGGGITGGPDEMHRIKISRMYKPAWRENTGVIRTEYDYPSEVIFDANNNELQLIRVDKNGLRLDKAKPGITFDFTKHRNPAQYHDYKGMIGDKTLNFCLDTGAESNVLFYHSPKK